MSAAPSKIVVTIHGIRTNGKWQKEVTPHLAKYGLIPFHIDYGYFPLLRFAVPWSRNRKIKEIRKEIRNLVHLTGARRISVIAHSFGTYIAIQCLMREKGDLLFDRLVLTGSIITPTLTWGEIFSKKWINAVRNDRATGDWVVVLAGWLSHAGLVSLAGASGKVGFTTQHPKLIEHEIDGDHSESHNVTKYEKWARFIAYPNMPPDITDRIRKELQTIRQLTSSLTSTPLSNIRANVFAPIGGALRMIPRATDNMKYAPEYDLCIEENHGGTGTAFVSGNVCAVLRNGDHWTGNHLPTDELDKVNPDLRWVVSFPVKSKTRKAVVAVVNIDGLAQIPVVLQNTSTDDCKAFTVLLWSQIVEKLQSILDAAFNGDQLPQTEA